MDLPEMRSVFFADDPSQLPNLWLVVRKKPMPACPDLPNELHDWVNQDFHRKPEKYIDRSTDELLDCLNREITILVERESIATDALPQDGNPTAVKVPEVKSLEDHPEVQDAWIEYIVSQWQPWAREMRNWREVQQVYENVDFMRRRIEEAEERYELVLGVGLLVWRDPNGTHVKRHLLTAPAEIALDATRGVLTVGPAASFEKFQIELDMLELQNQPHLDASGLDELLEALDVQVWNRAKVGEILHHIANRASPVAQVDENRMEPLNRADDTFRVVYAPAIILRERRPTAYEELVTSFLKLTENESILTMTEPWERFLSEGDVTGGSVSDSPEDPETNLDQGDRLYFPLPTNDEQRRIAERLRVRPYVLVKGPPGTGKSHTIANLICHLLASGERVLVTAHAPKALAVLKDLIPGEIRNLCVTAFGSSRDNQRLLEESVRGILSRKNEWKGEKWIQEEIAEVEAKLHKLEDEVVQVERDLRETREAETYSHTLYGDYKGTAAQIAREVDAKRCKYDWFPKLTSEHTACPLEPEEIEFLAKVHGKLTKERLQELCLEIGSISLPDPKEFEKLINELNAAERSAKEAYRVVQPDQLNTVNPATDEALVACEAFLKSLEEHAVRAQHVLGKLAHIILADLLVGAEVRWCQLAQEGKRLMTSLQKASERVAGSLVDISSDVSDQQLLIDARRRLEHFRKGGGHGFWVFAPRVVRETRYLEKSCLIDGQPSRQPNQLEKLISFLELRIYAKQFQLIWPDSIDLDFTDPRRGLSQLQLLINELYRLLELFENAPPTALDVVPIKKRVDLVESDGRMRWIALVRAEMVRRQYEGLRARLDELLSSLRQVIIISENPHRCLMIMEKAIIERNIEKWFTAWKTREHLKKEKDRFKRYEQLISKIEKAHPYLGALIRSNQGRVDWEPRLRQLQEAWAWAAARAWLRKVTDPRMYDQLVTKRQQLQREIKKTLGELAALKAWQAFFTRLDDKTEQSLTAWTKAVARIGKGTGKHAYRHRRAARRYLMECIPKIPAWIMPLHKLWNTTEPRVGLFDTVIVDEASQAGIEALVLLLLAKRIIIVGDEKQNSPEAVGVLEDDIARLARDHLRLFRFRDEFRPDSSLYDHAERAFGNVISLREHFRCVPEIIRFSNELCYLDTPLIPLREPPPQRLPPLKLAFVENGACQGRGSRIVNQAEADAIVTKILECLAEKAYEGKTMGVIVLQGHAQAELIERKLAEVLEPMVREERKLRCGVPATFQGDQRDVIFLSLVVAPNHNFRALTTLHDQRRFNVAMSRARDQVWLFYSVKEHDLNSSDLRLRLLKFFKHSSTPASKAHYEELERLEREVRRPRRLGEQPEPYESWFEVDVALELLRRGYRIRPQVEVAGYRIDLVLEGLYGRLAIECDGDMWHGPERHEYDMYRQRQLERAGWTFVRIRESEFYLDRKAAIRRITKAYRRLQQ